MQIRSIIKSFLLVISMSSVAMAQLVPGPPGGGGRPAPYPGQPPGGPGGGGGLVPGPRPPGPPPGWGNPNPRPPGPPPGHHHPPPPPPGWGGPNYPPPPPPPPSNPYPGNPYPGNPYPGNPGYGNSEVKRIYVGRDMINELMPIRSLAGLDYGYAGYEVVSVRANVRPNNYGRTVAQLILDGRVWATQIDPSYSLLLIPQQRLVLDQSGRDLRLSISGGIFVDSIDIEVRRDGGGYNPGPGYPQNININLYRSVYGNDRIDLTQYVDISRYRGYRIEQVIVTASTRYNGGVVNMMINGLSHGQMQFSGSFSQRQSLYLSRQPIIGQGADSLVLYTSGDMTIENVTLVVR